MTTNFQTNQLPTRATMWHDEATVISGGAIAFTVDANQAYNGYAAQTGPVVNNQFSQSFFLKAGTYTLYVLGETNLNNGQITWSIDGTNVITNQEWYSAAVARNVIASGSITVTGDGYHVLKGTVAAKNAGSGGYAAQLTKYWIKAASD